MTYSRFRAEPEARQEGKRRTPKELSGLFCAAVVLGSAMFGVAGCSGEKTVGELMERSATEAPVVAVAKEDMRVPKEAELFVMEFGDRYDDPVSTYFAYEAYKTSTGVDTVIPDGTLATYAETQKYANTTPEDGGPLGFSTYRLPLDAQFDESTLVGIFNTYTARQLSLYMNYLAKNQTPDGLSVVDTQFLYSCSDATQFKEDDRFIEALMSSAGEIVDRYGSAANYTVMNAAMGGDDPNVTSVIPNTFGHTSFIGYEDSDFYDATARMVIAVDVYDGSEVTRRYEVVDNARLTVIRQPSEYTTAKGFSFISIGLFAPR